MRIESYKEAKNLPEKYLPSLVDAEIECWWSRPFSEFRICKNDKCKATFSIEDVYWSIEEYQRKTQELKNIDNFDCKECNSETWYIYEKSKFINILKEKIKEDVIAVLLITNDDIVKWFWFWKKTTLWDILYNEIDVRPDSYDKEEAIKMLSKIIFNQIDSRHEEFVFSNQIYVSPSHRAWNISFEVLKALFNLKSKEFSKYPIVWETKYSSKFYPISRLMWYRDCTDDKYWNVLQYCPDYKQVLNFYNSQSTFTNKETIKKIIKFKKEAMLILKNNPHFTQRSFYN